jgi:hypothetical protein
MPCILGGGADDAECVRGTLGAPRSVPVPCPEHWLQSWLLAPCSTQIYLELAWEVWLS